MAGVSSAERGTNTTVIFAMTASGTYIPPVFIFPRQRMQESYKSGAPAESKFFCNSSGWSTAETCSKWFDHLVEHMKPTAESPILLVLDGHSSHTRNIEMLDKAALNHVRILTIPPHTSHKLQPLDVAFMAPFKGYYDKAVELFLKKNPGQAVTLNHISTFVNEAYSKAATIPTAINGFETTGILPFNPDIFTDKDFAASDFLEAANDPSMVFANIPPVLTGETMSSNNQTQGKHRGLSLGIE